MFHYKTNTPLLTKTHDLSGQGAFVYINVNVTATESFTTNKIIGLKLFETVEQPKRHSCGGKKVF